MSKVYHLTVSILFKEKGKSGNVIYNRHIKEIVSKTIDLVELNSDKTYIRRAIRGTSLNPDNYIIESFKIITELPMPGVNFTNKF